MCRFAIRTPFNLVNFAPELDSGKKKLDGYEPEKESMAGAWGGCEKILVRVGKLVWLRMGKIGALFLV